MTRPKITLTFDDLHTPEVDQRVQQQAALAGAQANSQRAAITPSRLPIPDGSAGSVWYNTFFNLALFGLIGGLLAWGGGEIVQHFNTDPQPEARDWYAQIQAVRNSHKAGGMDAPNAAFAVDIIRQRGADNPWFRYFMDVEGGLTGPDQAIRQQQLLRQDDLRHFLANVCFYSLCGTMLAMALGMAESVATRNLRGIVVYGAVGACLGLCGGIVVSLFANWLYHRIGGGATEGQVALWRQMLARATTWAILGSILSAGPGLVMANRKKFNFGLLGGFAGGFLGGALFDPIARATGSDTFSRLGALVAIGIISGVGTGIIENAAKAGWLKVVQGLIAGKQFIVYRNPTFIGAAPQCEVYLFKDSKVGRRHAALYIMPGGYDIEDLGTGSGTIVNGRPIRRTRLRNGDRIQIGATCFTFQERPRTT